MNPLSGQGFGRQRLVTTLYGTSPWALNRARKMGPKMLPRATPSLGLPRAMVLTRSLAGRYNSQSPLACVPIATLGAFMWASRWRRKFGAGHMSLRTEDPAPLDERINKVVQTKNSPPLGHQNVISCARKWPPKRSHLDTILGPPLLPHKAGQNRVQFLGTFLSPVFGTCFVQFCWQRCWFEGGDWNLSHTVFCRVLLFFSQGYAY
jgi:hypothetical protein